MNKERYYVIRVIRRHTDSVITVPFIGNDEQLTYCLELISSKFWGGWEVTAEPTDAMVATQISKDILGVNF